MKEIKVSKTLIIILLVLVLWLAVYNVLTYVYNTPPENPFKDIFKDKCMTCHEELPKSAAASQKDEQKEGEPKKKKKRLSRKERAQLRQLKEQEQYKVARFKKDIVSLCIECHEQMEGETLHPLDIKPSEMKSDILPLDSEGTLTCVTCHFPHSKTGEHGIVYSTEQYVGRSPMDKVKSLFRKQTYFKTFLLRAKALKGEMCNECHEVEKLATEKRHLDLKHSVDDYAGSESCGECHEDEYNLWKLTPHSRLIQDPKKNKSAIIGNFEGSPPFAMDEISFTIGVHWTQRYISERKGKLYVRSPIWSIQEDKWNTLYWKDMLWIKYCAGCHSTGYSPIGGGEYAETGISCESCHGPGKLHTQSESAADIVNPQKLLDNPETKDRKDMICEGCHTTGHDPTGEFKFPVGFYPGDNIMDFYIGLLPKPGQDIDTFKGDNTYEDRHNQFLFFQDSFFKTHGVTCDICKNFRANKQKLLDTKDGKEKENFTPWEYCMTCHDRDLPETKLHTKHKLPDVDCHDCHQPKLSPDKERYSIHDHKFMFIKPERTEQFTVEESCKHCHKTKQL